MVNLDEIISLEKTMRNVSNCIGQFSSLMLSFKVFTKIETIMLNGVADHVALPSQMISTRGSNIHNGVLIFHEVEHKLHQKT